MGYKFNPFTNKFDFVPPEIDGPRAKSGLIVGAIGDSRFDNGSFNPVGINTGRAMHGAGAWIEFLTYGRVRCPVEHNVAVGGTGTAELAGQITNLLAITPRATHCKILTGTNPIAGVTPGTVSTLVSTMQSEMRAAWARLKAAGITPITVLDCPRQWVDTTVTAAVKRWLHNEWNVWLRQAAPLYGSQLIDPIWKLTDPANANGECLTSYYYNESPAVHPGPQGCYQIGLLFKELFESGPLPPRYVGLGKGDFYATDNIHGNLIPEGGLCYSTGGLVNGGNPPTGDVPFGWILRNETGSANLTSCVGSLEARADGPGNHFKVAATASGPATVTIYNQGVYNCAIGDTLQYGVDVLMDASTGMEQCSVSVNDLTAGSVTNKTAWAMYFPAASAIGAMQPTFAGRAITNPLTLGANFGLVRWMIQITFGAGGGSCTVRLAGAELRKVFSTL
jgi:hypothetical protein